MEKRAGEKPHLFVEVWRLAPPLFRQRFLEIFRKLERSFCAAKRVVWCQKLDLGPRPDPKDLGPSPVKVSFIMVYIVYAIFNGVYCSGVMDATIK